MQKLSSHLDPDEERICEADSNSEEFIFLSVKLWKDWLTIKFSLKDMEARMGTNACMVYKTLITHV